MRRRRLNKIKEAEDKKNSIQEVPSMGKGIQEETIRENADKKDVGPYN